MPLSDLVLDSKIETSFVSLSISSTKDEEVTRHVCTMVGSTPRARQLRVEEIWKHERCIGEGSYGTVWLERRLETAIPSGQPIGKKGRLRTEQLRAVKEIKKEHCGPAGKQDGQQLVAVFLNRELEARILGQLALEESTRG